MVQDYMQSIMILNATVFSIKISELIRCLMMLDDDDDYYYDDDFYIY